jgi:hypothetical protein
MKNKIKIVPAALSLDGSAEIEASQMSESEKLADPEKEETAVDQPKKRRFKITLMPTYKPGGK